MFKLLGEDEDIGPKFKACRDRIQDLKQKIKVKLEKNKELTALKKASEEEKGLFVPDTPCAFRVRKKLPGHFGKIYALHWASNSEDLVSASQDGKLLVWNTITSNKKIAIPLKSAWVMTCAYSPNMEHVACGGLDNLCSIFSIKDVVGWELKNAQWELQQHEGYLSCCRYVNNEEIITSSGDATCILWDIQRQQPKTTFLEHNGDVESVAVLENRHIFVSGAIDAAAKVWDYRAGKRSIASFTGHETDINSVTWFPDGNAFASGSDDATVRLFDMKAHRQLNIYQEEEICSTVTSIDFSLSGYYLLAGYDEEPFCLAWNTMSGTQEATLTHETRASSLQISPNGNAVATGSWDKLIRIFA